MTSKIKRPALLTIGGYLTSDTGDYSITDAIPTGYETVSGRYYTSNHQYRPLQVGQDGRNLVIVGATATMNGRPYEIFLNVKPN
jgi:hypothetical protein